MARRCSLRIIPPAHAISCARHNMGAKPIIMDTEEHCEIGTLAEDQVYENIVAAGSIHGAFLPKSVRPAPFNNVGHHTTKSLPVLEYSKVGSRSSNADVSPTSDKPRSMSASLALYDKAFATMPEKALPWNDARTLRTVTANVVRGYVDSVPLSDPLSANPCPEIFIGPQVAPHPQDVYHAPSRKARRLYHDQFAQVLEERAVQFRSSISRNDIEYAFNGNHPYYDLEATENIQMKTLLSPVHEHRNSGGDVDVQDHESIGLAMDTYPRADGTSSFVTDRTQVITREGHEQQMAYTPRAEPLASAKQSAASVKEPSCFTIWCSF